MSQHQDAVAIRLAMNEALVLFEWLAAGAERRALSTDSAEQRVLWDLESQLETKLPMILSSDYEEQLARARRDVAGTNGAGIRDAVVSPGGE